MRRLALIFSLNRTIGLSFSTPDKLAAEMPDTMTLLAPDGLKTGEIWVRVKSQDSTAWIVGDAFCGADMYSDTKGPELLKPFPTYGLGDKDQYLQWFERQLAEDQPDTLVPCHGSVVQAPDLSKQLLKLIKERLCR